MPKEKLERLKQVGNYLPLGIVLSVALSLRLLFFTGMVRGDALNYAHTAYALSQGVFDMNAWAGMPRVGMYAPVAALYWVFGPSELYTLMFPMLASLTSIIFVYLITRMFASEGAGLIAALIWAFFPLDIHLATTLLPDGPLAATSTGAVYLFLRAERAIGAQRFKLQSLSLGLLLWSILIKPLAIITLIYMLVAVGYRNIPRFRMFWNRYAASQGRSKVWIAIIFILALVGLLFYANVQPRPLLITLMRANNDLLQILFTGAAELDFGLQNYARSDLLVFVAPLFLISLVSLIGQEDPKWRPILLWGIVLFLYYEWGTVGLDPLFYEPLQPFQEARYALFIFAPFVVLSAIHLGRGLSSSFSQIAIPLIGLATLVVAFCLKPHLYTGQWLGMTAMASLVLMIFTLLSAAIINRKTPAVIQHGVIGVLLLSLCISLLQPFLPYHAIMFQAQLDRLRAFQTNLAFWKEHNEYPICTVSSSDAMLLNYASNFDLGYAWNDLEIEGVETRIYDAYPNEDASCYVIGSGFETPPTWWQTVYFQAEMEKVEIFRVLDEVDARIELENAKISARNNDSIAAIKQLYGASINAASWADYFPLWVYLHQRYPEDYPLSELLARVQKIIVSNPINTEMNILKNSNFSSGFSGWNTPSGSVYEIETDQTFGDGLLVTAEGPIDGIAQTVELAPNQIYLFRVDIQTSTSTTVDVLSVASGQIGDTFSHSETIGSLTEIMTLFVTPDWDAPTQVNIKVFESFEGGWIRLRAPLLVPLVLDNNGE